MQTRITLTIAAIPTLLLLLESARLQTINCAHGDGVGLVVIIVVGDYERTAAAA